MRDTPHVDTDRGQDPAQAKPAGQPLVAGDAIRYRARPDDLHDTVWAAPFQIDFDFVDHVLIVRTGEGDVRSLPLVPQSVAAFYRSLMAELASLGIDVKIWTMPVEVPNPIRFEEDEVPSRV
jgi:hypothetical protein